MSKRKNLPYFVDRVGIELEGAFLYGRDMPYSSFHSDGSVVFSGQDGYHNDDSEDCECEDCTNDNGDYRIGEYVSDPLKSWAAIKNWATVSMPNMVNETCGTHVHVSVNNLVYMSALLERAEVICTKAEKAYTRWGRKTLPQSIWKAFSKRLGNQNTYCRKGSNVSSAINEPAFTRVAIQDYDRYRWLNFYALEDHGTIEFRLLPAFDNAKDLLGAINIILNIYRTEIHAYLKDDKVLLEAAVYAKETENSPPKVQVSSTPELGLLHAHLPAAPMLFTYDILASSAPYIGSAGMREGDLVRKVKRAAARKGKLRKVKLGNIYTPGI